MTGNETIAITIFLDIEESNRIQVWYFADSTFETPYMFHSVFKLLRHS